MAVKKVIIKKNQKLTNDQLEMLRKAAISPVEVDDELPAQMEEQLAQFRRLSELKKTDRRKQNVTLRLSPGALAKARALGKGYTSVLSRILEYALNDPELVQKCL